MNDLLVYMEIMVAITVLISFICGIFSYVVIRPLNAAITQLNTTVHDLENLVRTIDQREHDFDKRLTIVESSLTTLKANFDSLVQFCRRNYRGGGNDEPPLI